MLLRIERVTSFLFGYNNISEEREDNLFLRTLSEFINKPNPKSVEELYGLFTSCSGFTPYSQEDCCLAFFLILNLIRKDSKCVEDLDFNTINHTKCYCGDQSFKHDPLMYLILRFQSGSENFDTMLENYFSWSSVQQWKCNTKNCCGVKKMKHILLNIPRYLVIQLGRFDNNGNKKNQEVDFPWDNLELTSISERGSYELESIVCHIGDKISSGIKLLFILY